MARTAKDIGLTKKTLREVLNTCDGHTIFDPNAFVKMGVPKDMVDTWTYDHASDGTPKGSITANGKIVDELKGAYGLDILRNLAYRLDVDTKECHAIGRGTLARQYVKAMVDQVLNVKVQKCPPSS